MFIVYYIICLFHMKGKDKLVSVIPVLLHDIIVNVERGIPLRIEVKCHTATSICKYFSHVSGPSVCIILKEYN